ncbi:MAG: (2Fe-2S) ferredoxin domain-containing protein [Pseudomonadota bacterium]
MAKPERHLFVCAQSRPLGHPRGSCGAKGSVELFRAFQAAFEARQLWGRFALTSTGCLGPCDLGPSALVYPDGILYVGVGAEDINAIIEEHLEGGRPVRRLFPPPEVWPNDA